MTDAPESISIDITSEDDDGFFIAARTSDGYLNHDTNYVRIDLLEGVMSKNKELEETLRNASILAAYDLKGETYD